MMSFSKEEDIVSCQSKGRQAERLLYIEWARKGSRRFCRMRNLLKNELKKRMDFPQTESHAVREQSRSAPRWCPGLIK